MKATEIQPAPMPAGFKKYFAYALPEVERIVADLRTRPIQTGRRM